MPSDLRLRLTVPPRALNNPRIRNAKISPLSHVKESGMGSASATRSREENLEVALEVAKIGPLTGWGERLNVSRGAFHETVLSFVRDTFG